MTENIVGNIIPANEQQKVKEDDVEEIMVDKCPSFKRFETQQYLSYIIISKKSKKNY